VIKIIQKTTILALIITIVWATSDAQEDKTTCCCPWLRSEGLVAELEREYPRALAEKQEKEQAQGQAHQEMIEMSTLSRSVSRSSVSSTSTTKTNN